MLAYSLNTIVCVQPCYNSDTNANDDCLQEYQHHSNDEEALLLRYMEIDDKQGGSCTQEDANCS